MGGEFSSTWGFIPRGACALGRQEFGMDYGGESGEVGGELVQGMR